MSVYQYDPKAGLKDVSIINAVVAYTETETGQVVILVLNQMIEMKGLDHHHNCPIQCYMNGALIDDVPKCLAPVLSENTHAPEKELHAICCTTQYGVCNVLHPSLSRSCAEDYHIT